MEITFLQIHALLSYQKASEILFAVYFDKNILFYCNDISTI